MQKYLFIFFKFFKFFIFRYNIILPTTTRVFNNDFFFKDFYFFKKLNVNIYFFKLNILLLKRNSYFMGFSNSLIKLKKVRFRPEYRNIVFSKKNISNSLTSHYIMSISENKGNTKWSRRIFSNILLILADWSKIFTKSIYLSKNNFFLNSSISCENYFYRKIKEKEVLEFRRLGVEPLAELEESELNSLEYVGRIFLFESFFLNLGFSFDNFFDFCIETKPQFNWRYASKLGLLSGLSDGMYKGSLSGNFSGFLLKRLLPENTVPNYTIDNIQDFANLIKMLIDVKSITADFFLNFENSIDYLNQFFDNFDITAIASTFNLLVATNDSVDSVEKEDHPSVYDFIKNTLGPNFKEFRRKFYTFNKVNDIAVINIEKEFLDLFIDIDLVKLDLYNSENCIISDFNKKVMHTINDFNLENSEFLNFKNNFLHMPKTRLSFFKKNKLLADSLSTYSIFEGISDCKFSGLLDGSLVGSFKGVVEGKFSGKFSGNLEGSFIGLFAGEFISLDGTIINYASYNNFIIPMFGTFTGIFDGHLEGEHSGFYFGTIEGNLKGLGCGKSNGKLSALAIGNFIGKSEGKFFGKLEGSLDGRFLGYTDCDSEKYNFPKNIREVGNLIKDELDLDDIKKDEEGKTELDHYNDWESYLFNEISTNVTFEFIETMSLFLNKIFISKGNKFFYNRSNFFFNFYFFNTYCNNFFLSNDNTPLDFPYFKSLGYKEPTDIINAQHNNNIILNNLNFNNVELHTKLYFFFKRNSLLVLKKKYSIGRYLYYFFLLYSFL